MTLVEKIPNSIYLLSGRMFLLGIGFLVLVALVFVLLHPLVIDFYDSDRFEPIIFTVLGLLWGAVLLFYVILGVMIVIEWAFFSPFM